MKLKLKALKRNIYYYINNTILKNLINIKIKSIDETITYIVENKCSVSRFGDGELTIINGGNIAFQEQDETLRKRLKEVLKSNSSNIIICLPGPLKYTDGLEDSARTFWEENLKTGRLSWITNIDIRKQYYNAHMTRLYIDFKDKSKSSMWFDKIKEIWSKRDIVIIEGKDSKLGVGNDLFENTNSIERILAPNKNAFAKYDTILEEAKKLDKNKLILIALGPTATVLAYDLNRLGYQSIDIGHVDIEYEWYLRKSLQKENIVGKNTNESKEELKVTLNDKEYYNQIISSIR